MLLVKKYRLKNLINLYYIINVADKRKMPSEKNKKHMTLTANPINFVSRMKYNEQV